MAIDGTREVNLSSKNLTEIPQIQLLQCDHICVLNLSNNPGIMLKSTLGQFREVKKLVLRECALRELPDDIGELSKLEILCLAGNSFSDGLNPEMRRLQKLKQLDLRSCCLPDLPEWIFELKQLEELLLNNDASIRRDSRNYFGKSLNSEIGKLTGLKRLDLSWCCLTSLPSSIGQLTELEELNLSMNNLSQGIIQEIGGLSKLKKLNLHCCQLKSLPDCIGDLKQLEVLLLGGVTYLQQIVGNKFSDGLKFDIGRLSQLKILELRYCSLSCLPAEIGRLTKLEELLLQGNNFYECQFKELKNLIGLKKLDLNDCNLHTLSDSFGDLHQLEELLVQGNPLRNGLNTSIGRLVCLKKLNVGDCNLQSLPNNLENLEKLEELILQKNSFSNGLNPIMGRLHRLKRLDLRKCNLTSIPESIGELKELVDLQLSDNMLQEYPRCTLRINSLKILDASNLSNKGNCITQLPFELAFTSLEVLKINGNPITLPPMAICIQGLEAIKRFMKELNHGGALMHEDTINMIGDTGAGKTSLAQSLYARAPLPTTEANRTHVLQQLQMKTDERARQCVTINDFGGHELYHSVMPIFLSNNGLVVLVFDLSDNLPDKAVKKWLLTVISKCREIRVIIAGTHADQLTDSKERSAMEEKMTAIIFSVFLDALDEVDAHINSVPNDCEDTLMKLHQLRANLQNALADFLHSPISDVECQINRLRRRPDMLSNIRRFLARLERTETKRSISSNEAVRFVTLSCLVANELDKVYDLVVKLLRPPALFPATWFRIINDIRNKNVESLYITMMQVKDICKEHLAASEDTSAVTIILRYLSKTSQIIWREGHPELSEFIFHSPKTIIEVCKTLLHHNSSVPVNLSHYKSQIEEYKKGYLLEPLLKGLLSAHAEVTNRNEEYALPSSQWLMRSDVIVKFLQDFNLISYVATHSRVKTFIVPCKLESNVPSRLQKLEDKGNNCQNRVIVRLSFIGSIIPLALFETSLASMVTVACELAAEQRVCPDIWKEGLIIEHNEVYFISKMTESEITLTAFSRSAKPNPWTVLRPIFKRLTDNMTGSWHGASPRCVIVCPRCKWIHRDNIGNPQIGEIETELKTLSAIVQSDVKPTCPTCRKWIPRSLCFPTERADSIDQDQIEVQEFFRSIEKKRLRISTNGEFSSKRITSSEPGLSKTLASASPYIAEHLSDGELTKILLKLQSSTPPCILTIEKEDVESESGSIRRATKLLGILQKKSSSIIENFVKILQQIDRHDLTKMLLSAKSDQH